MFPEAPKENPKKEYSVQELIIIKEQFADEFMNVPGVNGIGVGIADVSHKDVGVVLFLERMPKKDSDLNRLISVARKLPEDVLLHIRQIGTIRAL
ncbi:hypothetical protein HYW46_06585 [Candidatus Daviesbacteria bacterium]|nr:hypothetical protein [Candidatus Daviesbacteria bacterium]